MYGVFSLVERISLLYIVDSILTETSKGQTPRVGPFQFLLLFFDSFIL